MAMSNNHLSKGPSHSVWYFYFYSSADSGSVMTPTFQEDWNQKSFNNATEYFYLIFPPDNITAIGRENITLIVNIEADTKETALGGQESVYIEEKVIEKGRVSTTKHFLISEDANENEESRKYKFRFNRNIVRLSDWPTRRMTGMKMNWSYVDSNNQACLLYTSPSPRDS